jgi:phosphate transport system permease protein
VQIYQWITRPQDEFRLLAAAGIIVLLAILLTMNAFAIWLRNRYQKRW